VPPAIECALQFTRRQPKPINRRAALHSLAARTPRHKHGRITYDYTQLALNPANCVSATASRPTTSTCPTRLLPQMDLGFIFGSPLVAAWISC